MSYKKGQYMKLALQTNFYENYAVHDWNGIGECPQKWKAKGITEYIVENYEFSDKDTLDKDVGRLSSLLHISNEACQQEVFTWELVEDSYIPYNEQQQIEHDNKVEFFEPLITLDGVVTHKFINSDGECKVYSEDLNSGLKEIVED